MASRKISDCDIRLQKAWQSAVTEWDTKNGLIPGLSCTYRSNDEQNEDYAKGRTTPGVSVSPAHPMGLTVTEARAGQSPHNCYPAQAFDFFFQKGGVAIWNDAESYAEFRDLILKADPTLVSGSSFKKKDNDHIETHDWQKKIPS